MCPQPPKKHDNSYFVANNRILDLLKNSDIKNICLTGGEPTTIKSEFLHVLQRINKEHPKALITILTNAKNFSNQDLCSFILPYVTKNTVFCVSLHSDIGKIHDQIVGKENSYSYTQEGIYNLSLYNIPVEIRFVINKLNCTRILEFAKYIYRYFPFVVHLAFMTQEICGYATDNYEKIYVDPYNYKNELRSAVLFLNKRGLRVSVYNTPICLCHPDIRAFSKRSISTWKNYFIDKCNNCLEKNSCCGFFSTSTSLVSDYISPIL
jgi:His-Xaa-Ser system radical SAM maturase HxsC